MLLINKTLRQLAINLHYNFLVSFFSTITATFQMQLLLLLLLLLQFSQLHLAIINEIPRIIWAIIRLAPAPWLLDLKNDDAQAPIHLAALTRQSNVVRRLVISGAKVCTLFLPCMFMGRSHFISPYTNRRIKRNGMKNKTQKKHQQQQYQECRV